MTLDMTVCCYNGRFLPIKFAFFPCSYGPIEISHSRWYMNDNSNAVIPFKMDDRVN